MSYTDFDYEEEYSSYYDGEESKSKLHRSGKKKFKGKGHQSRHGKRYATWDEIESYVDDDSVDESTSRSTPPATTATPYVAPSPTPVAAPSQPQQQPQSVRPFTPGPNTHTIKNNVIDFDRVVSIEKVESEHNGIQTYGIKFTFSGKRGSFRIAWFNRNFRERDSVYNTEFAFWSSLLSAAA